ncbi:MAG TPA: PHP domain-containing protein, partial [Candidatus Dormibacteraeota bacterium]|nr:PHP domain-containing protein [Candidatus Dormibacteraeota bacterium]
MDSGGGFVECWARSHFSFLEGASAPEALVERAVALGMPALGLVDRNGLYGAVRFTNAAARAGIGALVGAECDLDAGGRLVVLATERQGYQQLARAVSRAQLAGRKGAARLRLAGLDPALRAAAGTRPPALARRDAAPSPGVRRAARARPPAPDDPADPVAAGEPVEPGALDRCVLLLGGPHSPVTAALWRGDRAAADAAARALRRAFGPDRVLLALQHHLHLGDHWLVAETRACAQRTGLRCLVTNAPRYAHRAEARLLDVLGAIRQATTLEAAAAAGWLLPNHEYALEPKARLWARIPDPEAFRAATALGARAAVRLDFAHTRFPGFRVPPGETPDSYLAQLCAAALPRHYGTVGTEVSARLAHELRIIARTRLAEFFLIVWDLMRFARREGIPAQGRGSAADSLVAYLLGITRVDPIAHRLLFERFLHEDMEGTPDIDIDFSSEHREAVIRYCYDTYGPEHTGMVCTVITFQPRLAVRQVGQAFDLPPATIARLARSVDHWFDRPPADRVPALLEVAGLSGAAGAGSQPWQPFVEALTEIIDCPRHLSIHVGGMLVTGAPLVDVAPVERATMPGRVVVQFSKDDVEDLGLIKIDLLSLRTLAAVAEALDVLERATGSRPDLDALDLADPRVYDLCARADTIGVFQIESRAQQQTLPRTRPREFNDLVVAVAIIRPGPIQGHAVHPYLRRRQGREPVTYLHPSLEPIL